MSSGSGGPGVHLTADEEDAGFYVYAITFDQDTFGIFATRQAAKESLKRQIADGGPAWDGCEIERWRVAGTPEVAVVRGGGQADTEEAER